MVRNLDVDRPPQGALLQCLLPPPGRRYVRSFLFSRRINAPFAKVHLIARVMLVIGLSAALLRTINTYQPDPVGAALLWLVSLVLVMLSGMSLRVARVYFLLTLPALLALFMTWTVFNPAPGKVTLLHFVTYDGKVRIGLALWQVVFVALVGGYFLWRRQLHPGVIVGGLMAFMLARWVPFPEWKLTEVPFFHLLILFVSDRNLLVAGTKVIGYAGMILSTIALVITARDADLM